MVKIYAARVLMMLTNFFGFLPETFKTMYNNVLGRKMEEYHVEDRNFVKLDVSYLTSGMFYITANSKNLEPLKFIKL